MNSSNNATAAYAGGGVLFGILMSGIISDALAGQPYWLRLGVTAIAAGALAAVFVLVAGRLARR